MKTIIGIVAISFLATLASACASTLSPAVKKDLESQLATTSKPIAACYEAALKRNEKLAGKVVVKFKVAESSKAPTFVEVTSSDVKDEELTKCIVLETQDVRLSEAPEVPIAVTYPIELSLASPAPAPSPAPAQ